MENKKIKSSNLKEDISKHKRQLKKAISDSKGDLLDPIVITISQKLDKLIIKTYQ